MSTSTRITLEQLDQMIGRGDFQTHEIAPPRRELIDGEIRTMSPIGIPHDIIVDILTDWSTQSRLKPLIWARVQGSIGIPEHDSAPQPDLAWIRRGYDRSRRPKAPDIFLLIEVSDSSLTYDRTTKATLYAKAGVREYWIVNISLRQVEVHRNPRNDQYQNTQVYSIGQSVAPLAFPEITLEVATLFPNAITGDDDPEHRESD